MKKIFLLIFLAFAMTTQAQVYRERLGFTLESIADINIGWIKIYNHPNPPIGKTLGNRVYIAKQIGNILVSETMLQNSTTAIKRKIPKSIKKLTLLKDIEKINNNTYTIPESVLFRVSFILKVF